MRNARRRHHKESNTKEIVVRQGIGAIAQMQQHRVWAKMELSANRELNR
jgi:hypothetical protein